MTVGFEWDELKDALNQVKHGVSFENAQFAFDDPDRVILRDMGHEKGEKRFFCLGRVGDHVMTVRFTYRRKRVRISGQAIGVREGNVMKKKIRYSDEPLKLGGRVRDFLPPPGRLVKREKTIKVTLELTEDSLKFFKKHAKQQSVPYQRMLRNLVDAYVRQHETAH